MASDLSIPFATGLHRYLLHGRQPAVGRGLDIGRIETSYIKNLRCFNGDREAVVADGAEMRTQLAAFDVLFPKQVASLAPHDCDCNRCRGESGSGDAARQPSAG